MFSLPFGPRHFCVHGNLAQRESFLVLVPQWNKHLRLFCPQGQEFVPYLGQVVTSVTGENGLLKA